MSGGRRGEARAERERKMACKRRGRRRHDGQRVVDIDGGGGGTRGRKKERRARRRRRRERVSESGMDSKGDGRRDIGSEDLERRSLAEGGCYSCGGVKYVDLDSVRSDT